MYQEWYKPLLIQAAKQLFGYEQVAKRIANIRLTRNERENMRKIKSFCWMLFLLSIVISTNKTEAAVQDTNEGTSNVQWEDENFGESICNALKKEEVTYADIEGITGISIDSQYVVKLDWKDKTEEYVYNSGNDMCEILALQEFSTLEDLKKFPYLRELCLNECIVDDNTALGELTELENLKLDEYSIDSLDRLKNLTALKSLIIQGAEFEDLQALKELTNMEELRLPNNDIKNIDALEKMTNLEELILYGNQIKNISALSKLCKLRVLKLEGNLIEDVEPLLNLKNLEKLSLGDNPVKNVQLLENLTGTDIDLE